MGFKLSGKIKAVDEANGTAHIFDTRKLDKELRGFQKEMIKEKSIQNYINKDDESKESDKKKKMELPPEMIGMMESIYDSSIIAIEGYDYDAEDGNPMELVPLFHKVTAISSMIHQRLGKGDEPKNSPTASAAS